MSLWQVKSTTKVTQTTKQGWANQTVVLKLKNEQSIDDRVGSEEERCALNWEITYVVQYQRSNYEYRSAWLWYGTAVGTVQADYQVLVTLPIYISFVYL